MGEMGLQLLKALATQPTLSLRLMHGDVVVAEYGTNHEQLAAVIDTVRRWTDSQGASKV